MEYLPASITSLIHHPVVQQFTSSPFASNLAHLHTTYVNPSLSHLQETLVDPSLAHLRLTYFNPYVIEPLSRLFTSMSDVVSVLTLIIILFISFKILDYTRRLVMFWVSLAVRLVWWAAIISGALYMHQNGAEKTAQDLAWALGAVKGFVENFCNAYDGSS